MKEPEPGDPMALVGIRLPALDEGPMREMALCFIEEFLRMGHPPEEVLALFRDPFYGGAHAAYRALGEEQVVQMVDELARIWARGYMKEER